MSVDHEAQIASQCDGTLAEGDRERQAAPGLQVVRTGEIGDVQFRLAQRRIPRTDRAHNLDGKLLATHKR